MVNGRTKNNNRNTREIRPQRLDTGEFNRYNRIFGENKITRLNKRKTKAERKIRIWERQKEEFEKKDDDKIKVKEYETLVKKIEKKDKELEEFNKELEEFKKALSEGISLYLSLPLRMTLRSDEISMDLVNEEKIEKGKVLERINKNIDFPSVNIQENFANTTYNVTLNLVEKIKRYKIKKDKIESKYERRTKLIEEMKEMNSNYTLFSIKALELGITMGSLFGLNYINRVNQFINNLSPNEIIFYIIPTTFTISNAIDKLKKVGLKIYKKIITKKKEKNSSELRQEFRENKKKMLNSLYGNVSENIFIYLEEKINNLKSKKVINEEEYKHYKSLINRDTSNDKDLIEQKAETIEKEL